MDLRCLVVGALFAFAAATDVIPCPGGKKIEGLSEDVLLQPCKKAPCKLKKGTNQHVKIQFTPETDLPEVINHVTANVFGIDLPFIGVDGNNICDKLETTDGEKASCPLKAGTKYVYKDSFPVLRVYPTLQTTVHWALQYKSKDITCFEVKAAIS